MSDLTKAQGILTQLKAKKFHPIYFLEGDEPFYIDQVIDALVTHALPPSEKNLNLITCHGKEHPLSKIISYARSFPMLGKRKLIIVKNAQEHDELKKKSGQESLISYLKKPHENNIIAIAYKNKKLSKQNPLTKAIHAKGILLTTSRLYESKVPAWIETYAKTLKYHITPEGAIMLESLVGNNLSSLASEIKKIILNYPQGSQITADIITQHVGMQKEFNNFTLQNALSQRNPKKTLYVLQHFIQNQQQTSLLILISLLTTFFSKVLQVYALYHHNPAAVATKLKVHPYFIKQYFTAARSYTLSETIQILHDLQHADNQVKGINSPNLTESAILEELVAKILHPSS